MVRPTHARPAAEPEAALSEMRALCCEPSRCCARPDGRGSCFWGQAGRSRVDPRMLGAGAGRARAVAAAAAQARWQGSGMEALGTAPDEESEADDSSTDAAS